MMLKTGDSSICRIKIMQNCTQQLKIIIVNLMPVNYNAELAILDPFTIIFLFLTFRRAIHVHEFFVSIFQGRPWLSLQTVERQPSWVRIFHIKPNATHQQQQHHVLFCNSKTHVHRIKKTTVDAYFLSWIFQTNVQSKNMQEEKANVVCTVWPFSLIVL